MPSDCKVPTQLSRMSPAPSAAGEVGASTREAQPGERAGERGEQAGPATAAAAARHPFHVNGNASCLKKVIGT